MVDLTEKERQAVKMAADVAGDLILNPELLECFRQECEAFGFEYLVPAVVARVKALRVH